MEMPEPVVETDLEGLELINRGKVRDMYAVDDRLLIVTTDRISAYDSVLGSAIPWKGKVLTTLTEFWLDFLSAVTMNHLLTTDVGQMGPEVERHADVLAGRTMLVKKADVLPVECVVRGYLAGSGWRSYKEDRTVCGIELPKKLKRAGKLPEPIFTPATKAEEGHDENISFERACELVGEETMSELRRLSLELYAKARDYAAERGIIIADTKFEFGRDEDGKLMLIDEALTPDSSRFWPADQYKPGKAQPSFDKQFLRDYLDKIKFDRTPPAPPLPAEIVQKTRRKYIEAYTRLTGKDFAWD